MKKRSRQKNKADVEGLPILEPHSAGIDLGSREHCVCAPTPDGGEREVCTFETTTPQLLAMADWLKERKVKTVAMESTGVYWVPVYEILERAGFEVLLVNARHVRSVSGRKSDPHDCRWIQRLHACGLLSGSFRPEDRICPLRALMRQTANYVEARSTAVQWIQKALDQMNVAVHRAVSDVTGVTGMQIIRAIVAGERDPKVLAELRDKRCKKSKEEIAEYLTGNWREEHLFNLEEALRHFDDLEATINRYEDRIMAELKALAPEDGDDPPPINPNPSKEKSIRRHGNAPLRDALFFASGVDLTAIDGINVGVAAVVLSELGCSLDKFPNERAFVKWLRLCPNNPTSAGKVLHKKTRGTGSSRVSRALRQAAVSVRKSNSALGAEYRRTARRCGAGSAVFAVARRLAKFVFRMLRYGRAYVDVGAAAYEERFAKQRFANFLRQAEAFGVDVVPKLKPA